MSNIPMAKQYGTGNKKLDNAITNLVDQLKILNDTCGTSIVPHRPAGKRGVRPQHKNIKSVAEQVSESYKIPHPPTKSKEKKQTFKPNSQSTISAEALNITANALQKAKKNLKAVKQTKPNTTNNNSLLDSMKTSQMIERGSKINNRRNNDGADDDDDNDSNWEGGRRKRRRKSRRKGRKSKKQRKSGRRKGRRTKGKKGRKSRRTRRRR